MLPILLSLACAAPSAGPDGASAAPAAAPPEARTAPAAGGAAPGRPVHADMHIDTPLQLYKQRLHLDSPGMESALPQMRAGGTNLPTLVLWPPRGTDARQRVEDTLAILEAEDARLDEIALARSPAEARATIDGGRTAFLVSLEGAHGLGEGSFEGEGRAQLERLHARGLSMAGLTWSFSNRYAGSSGDAGGGLTADGRALIAAANRLGIMVDVSHASRAATLEACALSTAPLVASHSDAAAVNAHARNLSDAEIDCIAKGGGVIGVNLYAAFLGSPASAAKAADHLDHLRTRGGVGVVALGSDYDGLIRTPPDLPDASHLPKLWAELERRGWSASDLTAVQGENFLRVWGEVLDAGERLSAAPPTPPSP